MKEHRTAHVTVYVADQQGSAATPSNSMMPDDTHGELHVSMR
jgi:hypothetical protein